MFYTGIGTKTGDATDRVFYYGVMKDTAGGVEIFESNALPVFG
jgi:hypothetical protein